MFLIVLLYFVFFTLCLIPGTIQQMHSSPRPHIEPLICKDT